MNFDFTEQSFIIIKGYIDAKDDRGDDINGVFFAVASMNSTQFQGSIFSRDKDLEKKNREEIFNLINNKDNLGEERDFLSIQCEEELNKYFEMSRLLNGIAKNHNIKHAEQIISRFFMDKLRLKAVTFIEYTNPSPLELDIYIKTSPKTPPNKEKTVKPAVPPTENLQDTHKKDDKDLLLMCEPVYDPVMGVAPTELENGSVVLCKLPDSSIFYKLLQKNIQNFDGTVEGEVSGISFNDELGSATLALSFSDGVSGVVKLSSKARIKITSLTGKKTQKEKRRKNKSSHNTSDNIVFLVAFFIIASAAIAVIIYLMNGI